MKTIMLINDDGVHSSGLLALKQKLDKLGRVVVVTPEEEKSGIGKAITSAEHVRVEEARLSDGSKAYVTSGTPADSFLLGMHKILKQPPDLVVAGINLGPNLGIDDFLNSGTLGAAIEAAIHGVPAVAVSYCKKQFIDREADKRGISSQELELTASIAAKVVKLVLEKGMPEGVDILSVNVPEKADSKKLKVTTLSYVGYKDIYSKETEGYRIAQWRLADYSDAAKGTDVHAVKQENCIAITPVKIKLQHNTKALENMMEKFWQNDD